MSSLPKLVKFATQVDETVLAELKTMAYRKGRKVQTLVGEALANYLANQKQGFVRPEILESLRVGRVEFGDVYKVLVHQP